MDTAKTERSYEKLKGNGGREPALKFKLPKDAARRSRNQRSWSAGFRLNNKALSLATRRFTWQVSPGNPCSIRSIRGVGDAGRQARGDSRQSLLGRVCGRRQGCRQ